MERVSQLVLQITADIWEALVGDYHKAGCPFREFKTPVRQGGKRNDDEIGTWFVLTFDQVGDKRDCLNGFAKPEKKVLSTIIHPQLCEDIPHLICQNTVQLVVVQAHHPLQSL